MIGYLDTSAFVPLILDEDGTIACRRFWDDADDVSASHLLYVESAAALAQAERMGRLTAEAHRRCLRILDRLWSEVQVVEVEDALVRRAAELARRFGLRGYDAVHCASAEQLAEPDMVAASGDRKLLAAWASLDVATFDPDQAQPGR